MLRRALLVLGTATAACGLAVVGNEAPPNDGGTTTSSGGSSGGVDADGSTIDGSSNDGDATSSGTNDGAANEDAGPYGGRVKSGLVALYEMQEGAGSSLSDTSGFGAPLTATFTNTTDVVWVKGGVTALNNNVAVTTGNATKVAQAAKASNEVSVEVWVRFTATPLASYARLVSFSTNSDSYNIAVTTKQSSFWYYLSTSDAQTGSEVALLPTGIVHLIGTYKSGLKSYYVNGALLQTVAQTGTLASWLDTYPLSFFNTTTKDRPMFPGELHLVAFYSRALSATEVTQNFNAGANPSP